MLHAAGLEDLDGLRLHQRFLPGIPEAMASVYDVSGGGQFAELAALTAPASEARAVNLSVWLVFRGGPTDAWLVDQGTTEHGASVRHLRGLRSLPASSKGITGCDVLVELLSQLFPVPGPGLLLGAACDAPGPEGAISWESYDPLFPQTPADYYDKGMRYPPVVGDSPVAQVFDVRYYSQRCFKSDMLVMFSQSPNFPYTGDWGSCISVSESDPAFGHYVVITALFRTDVRWFDGRRQVVSVATNRNEYAGPTVAHENTLLPTGDYTAPSTATEYWPEYCEQTYAPTLDPRDRYYCKVGQVRDHRRIVRTL